MPKAFRAGNKYHSGMLRKAMGDIDQSSTEGQEELEGRKAAIELQLRIIDKPALFPAQFSDVLLMYGLYSNFVSIPYMAQTNYFFSND